MHIRRRQQCISSNAVSSLVELRLACICWFDIGMVSKCVSCFGWYIPSPSYFAAPATKPVVWCAQFEQLGTQVLDPRRRSEIKKIKNQEWPAAKSSSITHYHIYHLCCGDHKNNTDRWSASTSQLVLFNTPAALHQSIYMYLLGNLFER